MPRLRERDQDSGARRFNRYQEETRVLRLSLANASTNKDAVPDITLALASAIYGKQLRFLPDWGELFTRMIGVSVTLSHHDVLQGEFVSFREAWQIAYDDSRVRARVAYLEGITPGFPVTQTSTDGSPDAVQSDPSRWDDNSANTARWDTNRPRDEVP